MNDATHPRLTLLQQNPFQQRILVSQHETLVSSGAMALLQTLKLFFMVFDRGLQLFDILRPPLSEGRLCLAVPLFSLFRCGIDLSIDKHLDGTMVHLWARSRACGHPCAFGPGRPPGGGSVRLLRARNRQSRPPRNARFWGPAVCCRDRTSPRRRPRSDNKPDSNVVVGLTRSPFPPR